MIAGKLILQYYVTHVHKQRIEFFDSKAAIVMQLCCIGYI